MIEPIFELNDFQLKIIAKETWKLVENNRHHIDLTEYLSKTTEERHSKTVVHCKHHIEEYLTVNADERAVQNVEIMLMVLDLFEGIEEDVVQTVNRLGEI